MGTNSLASSIQRTHMCIDTTHAYPTLAHKIPGLLLNNRLELSIDKPTLWRRAQTVRARKQSIHPFLPPPISTPLRPFLTLTLTSRIVTRPNRHADDPAHIRKVIHQIEALLTRCVDILDLMSIRAVTFLGGKTSVPQDVVAVSPFCCENKQCNDIFIILT